MKSLTVIETNDLAEILRSIVRQELDARERPNEIMTKQQLCDYTGWSISTINRKMKAGLPYFGGEGEHPRFSKSKVDEWLTKEQSYL
jgi:predicted DNA-binding transcriptional regulator AlpA